MRLSEKEYRDDHYRLEYDLVQGRYYNFRDAMKKYVKDGWKPKGGVSSVSIGSDIHYSQSVVRYVKR